MKNIKISLSWLYLIFSFTFIALTFIIPGAATEYFIAFNACIILSRVEHLHEKLNDLNKKNDVLQK